MNGVSWRQLVAGEGKADLDTLRQACGSSVTTVLRALEERGLVRMETTATRKYWIRWYSG